MEQPDNKPLTATESLYFWAEITHTMYPIFLEAERLRNPYSGLGQYCHSLAFALHQAAPNLMLGIYAQENPGLPGEWAYLPAQTRHKLTGVPAQAALWHSLHQESSYLPRDKRIPVVVTLHDLNFLEKYQGGGMLNTLKRNRSLWKVQSLINRANTIIFISNFSQQTALEHLHFSNRQHLAVILNGVSLPALPAPPTFAQQLLNKPFLFSIGIIQPKKNFHVLLPLLEQHSDLWWVVAGHADSDYAQEIWAKAQATGVADRIIMPGIVSEGEKAWLYQHCLALAFPSLTEGFGIPVIEAMQHGKPAFLSDRASLPEIGGQEAFYWPSFEPEAMRAVFANGLRSWYHDPARATAARARAAAFSWDRAAGEYLNIYKKLL